jgi:hypothetical protein
MSMRIKQKPTSRLKQLLKDKNAVRAAMLIKEILSKPLALNRY